MSDIARTVEEAGKREPALDEVSALAAQMSVEHATEALAQAMTEREVDAAAVLALVLLAKGEPPPADVVERLYPDVVDERAGNVLVAAHPARVEILERLFASRRPDRYQLAMAAALYTHLESERETPASLRELLRRLARNRPDWIGAYWAREAALRVDDPTIDSMYGLDREKDRPDPKLFDALGDDPGIGSLHAERSKVVATGFTARRATPKVGRNDPCPCGSGKKYKKCCAGKKDDRISLSPVAGITMREYRRRLHEFLDAEGLVQQHPADLACLPLSELDVEQLDACLQVFVECERMDEAELALAERGGRKDAEAEDIDALRAYVISFAHDWGHEALVERHVALFADPDKVPPYVQLGQSLRHPTSECLEIVDSHCRTYVVEGGPPPHDLAYELLATHPSLGILLTRGILDLAHPEDSPRLLDEVEWARDKLGAPPNEPYWPVWEAMVDQERLAKASDAEKEALREELERMRAEAQDARAQAHVVARELNRNRSQLAELEARAEEADVRADERLSEIDPEGAAREAAVARDLRSKIRELQGLVREGHNERNELRRRVASAARVEVVDPLDGPSDPVEEEPGDDVSSTHGLRIPVWTERAKGSMEKLPKNVRSHAIAVSGGLGAGRPEAWRHAKRLEGMHGLCSARVGIHHRLLFRMDESDVLEVHEVVTREGLDRALAKRR